MAHDTFAQFTREVDGLVRGQGRPEVLISLIQPLLSRLLTSRDWLDESYQRPVPGKSYTQYLWQAKAPRHRPHHRRSEGFCLGV
jgi:predicted metal-dependent enzyme (double-stranded beta helix superfamily)